MTRRCQAESAANDPPAFSAPIRVAAADMDLKEQVPEQQDDRQLTLLRLGATNSVPKPLDATAVARLLHHG